MASKKDIKATLNSIVGVGSVSKREPLKPVEEDGVSKEMIEELNLSAELAEALQKRRSQYSGKPSKAGRPARPDEEREREQRATFILDKELVRQLKYVSLVDTRMLKEVVSEAINDYLRKWESQKGIKIELPKE